MCGRFTLTEENREWVAAQLGVPPEELREDDYRPRWNIAPMQEHWIVRSEQEERHALWATWGLVNWWAASRREGAKHINARAEQVAQRRPFREAFESRRCIVPADGFFEWQRTGKATPQPYWYHRADGGLIYFAGLYEFARLKGEPEQTPTFTIITTDANELVSTVHDRMPVILRDDEVDEWLFERQSPDRLRALLRPAPPDLLAAKPVSTRVNSVANDDPACLAEVDAGPQGALL